MNAYNYSMLESIHPRVISVVFDPSDGFLSRKKLSQRMHWNRAADLSKTFIEDVHECSGGLVNYQVVDQITLDELPAKVDGFQYSLSSYMDVIDKRTPAHSPDTADYHHILEDLQIIERIQSGEADEVWLFGPPFAGFYESRMVGHNAFWCNAPPVENTSYFPRRFVVMGFSYERGVGEMLEDLGHRTESLLEKAFEKVPGDANLWKRFTRYERIAPGQAEVGTIHFAPNSRRDYDWGNTQYVPSKCDNWLHFPDLEGKPRPVNCSEWGNGDIRQHHKWWLKHLPRTEGNSAGISNNWWDYLIRVDHAFFDRQM